MAFVPLQGITMKYSQLPPSADGFESAITVVAPSALRLVPFHVRLRFDVVPTSVHPAGAVAVTVVDAYESNSNNVSPVLVAAGTVTDELETLPSALKRTTQASVSPLLE